jgi:hypothetical protein
MCSSKKDPSNKPEDVADYVSALSVDELEDYPEEAVEVGTYVRSTRFDRLGIVTDAFYGDRDQDGQKIIVYSILMFPKKNTAFSLKSSDEQYHLSNEYEYEVIAYLMKKPAKLSQIAVSLGGGTPQ